MMSKKSLLLAASGLALAATARGATIVQNFSQTYALTASPAGAVPSINATWNVAQYNGALAALTQVKYDVTTAIYYRGTLIAVGANKSYNLQVRSDFNFNLPGTAPDITAVDPTISQFGTSPATTLTTFTAPTVGGGYPTPLTATTTVLNTLATDFSTYVGAGTVPVVATGSLLTTSSGGSYQNTSDIGVTTPYVFVDNAKVFPMFGLQEYSLVATLTVTYTVPEPGTYAAIGFVAFVAGHQVLARRKRRTAPVQAA